MKPLVLALLLLCGITAIAQKAFNKNDRYLQFSYSAFGNKLNLAEGAVKENIYGTASGFKQFSLGFEYGVAKNLGLGFQTGISSTKFQSADANSSYRLSISNYYLQVKAVGYLINTKKFNLYSTFGVGLQQQNTKFTDLDNQSSNNPTLDKRLPISTNLSFGARYYITKNIAIHADAGLINWNPMQIGITVRF